VYFVQQSVKHVWLPAEYDERVDSNLASFAQRTCTQRLVANSKKAINFMEVADLKGFSVHGYSPPLERA
jgi:hypothetical protein